MSSLQQRQRLIDTRAMLVDNPIQDQQVRYTSDIRTGDQHQRYFPRAHQSAREPQRRKKTEVALLWVSLALYLGLEMSFCGY